MIVLIVDRLRAGVRLMALFDQHLPPSYGRFFPRKASQAKSVTDRKLRIAIILTQLEPGGAQAAALRLAAGLRGRGHYVHLIFLYHKHAIEGESSSLEVLFDRRPSGLVGFTRLFFKLCTRMRELRPDAVVTFTHYSNVLGQLAAFVVGAGRRVASQRNPPQSFPSVVRLADRLLGTIGLYHVNVAVSHAVSAAFGTYPKQYRKRLVVIPNGIPACSSELTKSQAKAQLGFSSEVALVVAVGRLSPQKNHAVLIRAMVRLPGAHLVIVGEGELRDELRSLCEHLGVASRVHLTGNRSRDQVATVLRAGDLFAMPSLYEGMSNALLEAISEGLPCIASDIPPNAEVLRGEGFPDAGILLPVDDVEQWAESISRVLDDTDLSAELSMRAKERAKHFTLERMINEFETVIRGDMGELF